MGSAAAMVLVVLGAVAFHCRKSAGASTDKHALESNQEWDHSSSRASSASDGFVEPVKSNQPKGKLDEVEDPTDRDMTDFDDDRYDEIPLGPIVEHVRTSTL